LTIDDRWVVDLKFSGDSFRDVPGKGTGCTQGQDYTQINQQKNPGNPGAGKLSLDPETCGCKDKSKKPRQIEVEENVTTGVGRMLIPGVDLAPQPLSLPGGAPGPVIEAPGSLPGGVIETPGLGGPGLPVVNGFNGPLEAPVEVPVEVPIEVPIEVPVEVPLELPLF
jgi:hypothetical protein